MDSNQYELNIELLESLTFEHNEATSLNETMGTYSPLQYAISLNPKIHAILKDENIPNSDFRKAQAFSTYLHESIHWWQHIGSYAGFIVSFLFPIISHNNREDIISLQNEGLLFKSIHGYAKHINKDKDERVNRIINNTMDVYYAYLFLLDPRKNVIIKDDVFFDSLGHSLFILWHEVMKTLKTTFLGKTPFFDDSENWFPELYRVKKEKPPRSYFGNDIALPPFGTKAIFEGQAKFSQLQYLEIASEGFKKYPDFKNNGHLHGIYAEAFDFFLNYLGLNEPDSTLDPVVNLFLLVCDVSINPTDGFPHQIVNMDSWALTTQPGNRFAIITNAIKKEHLNLVSEIVNCSNEEYFRVSSILHEVLDSFDSKMSLDKIVNACQVDKEIIELLKNESDCEFGSENFPIKFFTSKFLRFQIDKQKNPCFFCWPGVNMTSNHSLSDIKDASEMFERHKPLFSDDGTGQIRATKFLHLDEMKFHDLYNRFYSWITLYNMSFQLIMSDGVFKYDYHWFTEGESKKEVEDWVNGHFERAFGFHPNNITT